MTSSTSTTIPRNSRNVPKKLDFWYDAQIRRYLLQFTRVFSVFHYSAGIDKNGNEKILPVPCRYASTEKTVASILRNNSENSLLSLPIFIVYLDGVEIDRNRTQVDEYIEKRQIYEKIYNEVTEQYENNPGNTYTLERRMPVPLNLKIKVDLITSNIDQKLQLFEQIAVLFNPSIDLTSSTNPWDWCSLTIIEPDLYEWSSRTIPIGVDNYDLDILTMTFTAPIWISPPAKLKPQKVIHQIVANIRDLNSIDAVDPADVDIESADLLARMIFTPENYQLRVEGNILTLLTESGGLYYADGTTPSWKNLLDLYGQTREGISEIRLRFSGDIEDDSKDIRGIFYFTTNINQLLWAVDPISLPPNTLPNINGIINPHHVYPGSGIPSAAVGQRYIIVDELGTGSVGWGAIVAKENDIIEYNGTNWFVAFDASSSTSQEIVLNLATNKQLKWTGSEWILAIDGDWLPGLWRIFL